MNVPDPTPGQVVVDTDCWGCGTRLYKSVPRRQRGPGHVAWACADCDVAWSEPAAQWSARGHGSRAA